MGISSRGAVIGTQDSARSYCFEGYVDEIRISNTARYTSGFTPSTTAFTTDDNTLVLIHSNWNGGLGADSSGNLNTFSATNLVAADQMVDSPTNNFCTINALTNAVGNLTFSEGNLKAVRNSGSNTRAGSTIDVSSGKWYWETMVGGTASNGGCIFGVADADATDFSPDTYFGSSSHFIGFAPVDQTVRNSGNSDSYGSGSVANDSIIGFALDLDNNFLYISLNGTFINSGDPTSGATGTGNVNSAGGNVSYSFTGKKGAYFLC